MVLQVRTVLFPDQKSPNFCFSFWNRALPSRLRLFFFFFKAIDTLNTSRLLRDSQVKYKLTFNQMLSSASPSSSLNP